MSETSGVPVSDAETSTGFNFSIDGISSALDGLFTNAVDAVGDGLQGFVNQQFAESNAVSSPAVVIDTAVAEGVASQLAEANAQAVFGTPFTKNQLIMGGVAALGLTLVVVLARS